MQETVRVILVDDHEVVRLGLMALLENVPWVEVVAEAGTAAEAVEAVDQRRPDVVVMDIRMPGGSGIDACRQITSRWPETRVIMLTSFADDELIFQALQAGASGYVLKQVGNQSLIDALDAVRRGDALLDPGVTQRVLTRMRQLESERQSAAFRDLSEREIEVLAEVAKGKSNVEIAVALSLSEKTVRNHVSAILAKLNLANRVEAATYAIRHGIERHLPGRRL
ncbi:MAG: response regulator transcription factor [Chloroflexi bacterium]|nr:response regulator transcription factor [Chloroflexota bacterium]MCI0648913.1 response regulator transcription factor [Chloroflexota bacterium]MCI0731111.1 response regulator transcription factor [Chloroflexota bacterium]